MNCGKRRTKRGGGRVERPAKCGGERGGESRRAERGVEVERVRERQMVGLRVEGGDEGKGVGGERGGDEGGEKVGGVGGEVGADELDVDGDRKGERQEGGGRGGGGGGERGESGFQARWEDVKGVVGAVRVDPELLG